MSVSNGVVVIGLSVFFVVAGALATAGSQEEIRANCKQEAVDYDIQPEQVAEYIDGCIQSMGGTGDVVPDELGSDTDSIAQETQTERAAE